MYIHYKYTLYIYTLCIYIYIYTCMYIHVVSQSSYEIVMFAMIDHFPEIFGSPLPRLEAINACGGRSGSWEMALGVFSQLQVRMPSGTEADFSGSFRGKS